MSRYKTLFLTCFLLISCYQAFHISSENGEVNNSELVLSWSRSERFLAGADDTFNSTSVDNSTTSESDQDGSSSTSLVLAPRRTFRKDPLDDFNKYTGGLNIRNNHYWASVAYTAFPLFLVAAIWFLLFAICLALVCVRHCCCKKEPYGYSRAAYALSLIFLVLFTIVAIIGCLVLYIGQGKFNSSTTNTMNYVVHQAETTSENLRNVSGFLSAAKEINIDQVLLASNFQSDIDEIQAKLDSSATTLTTRTRDNSDDIKRVIRSVRVALIVVSAVMLLLTFLGFVFSLLGMQFLVYILVIAGWILVTGTFILCGVFLLFHNVTGDTCVAMNQWLQHPTAHTALDDILPCVDNATALETLTKSKQVTSQMVDLINTVISNVSNINFAPSIVSLYYNQSGPLVPSLCNPFNPDLTDRTCTHGEVDLDNATQVWNGFVCQTSPSGICISTGRLTPAIYSQMTSGINVSYGLVRYGPFLVELQDCTYVRQAFSDIESLYCPGLRKYSHWIYVGLEMVGTAVMLSLVLWVIYGRERKHRIYTKEHVPKGVDGLEDDKRT